MSPNDIKKIVYRRYAKFDLGSPRLWTRNALKLSEIFEWYKGKFPRGSIGAIIFIKLYLKANFDVVTVLLSRSS